MISLSKFITSGLFLKEFDLKEKFDVIVFEKKIPDFIDVNNYNCITLLDIGLDFQAEGQITSLFDNYEKPLFIIDELPINNFYQILDEYFGNITIINCNVGLSSFYSKTNLELNDMIFADELNMEIFEPFDKISLEQILKQKTKEETKIYIRLEDKDYPSSLLEEEQIKNILNQKESEDHNLDINSFPSIIDLTSQKNEKVENTILCSGATLPESVQSAQILQKEDKQNSDIFLTIHWNGIWTESFINHCKTTGNLIIICDQEYNQDLKIFFDIKKEKHNLQNININIICPSINKISTVLQDYIYEQSEFDANGIIKKIRENL